MRKFLYGKKVFLQEVVDGLVSPRFTDISHYSRMDNESMRDDEGSKFFSLSECALEVFSGDCDFRLGGAGVGSMLSIPTEHCYCLCLSGRGNDPELFEKFKADICIEIDVEVLLDIVGSVLSHRLKGAAVDAREITYYEPSLPPISVGSRDLVFFKPIQFSHEAEFRVVIFYPKDKRGFICDGGVFVPFSIPGDSLHISFSSEDSSVFKRFVKGVFEFPGFCLG